MAYAQPYKYDVFYSYATADDLRPFQGTPGRAVQNTRDRVSLHLSDTNLLPRPGKAETWFDSERLRDGNSLTDDIAVSVAQARVLVVFLSQSYLASGWCMAEIGTWLRRTGASADWKGRLFIVSLDGTGPAELVAVDQELTRWKVISLHAATLQPLTSGGPELNALGLGWDEILNSLSRDIAAALKKQRTSNQAPSVFLADSDRHPAGQIDQFEDYLESKGIRVIRNPLPSEHAGTDHYLSQLNDLIISCDAFFQIVRLRETPTGITSDTYEAAQRNVVLPTLKNDMGALGGVTTAQPLEVAAEGMPGYLLWLPRGEQAPVSLVGRLDVMILRGDTEMQMKDRICDLARIRWWRKRFEQSSSKLLVVGNPLDMDAFDRVEAWIAKYNMNNEVKISYHALVEDGAMDRRRDFEGRLISEIQGGSRVMFANLTLVYGRCERDSINSKLTTWGGIRSDPLFAPLTQGGRTVVTTFYFPPVPKQPPLGIWPEQSNFRTASEEEFMKYLSEL